MPISDLSGSKVDKTYQRAKLHSFILMCKIPRMVNCKICGRDLTILNNNHLMRLHKITVGEYLEMFPGEKLFGDDFKRGMPRRHTCNETFFDIWSPEMAYCLGLLFSDGYILRQRRLDRDTYPGFAIDSIDFDIPMNISEAIRTTAPIVRIRLPNERFRLVVISEHAAQSLISLGCVHRKTGLIQFPQMDENLHQFFIRGFFEGDGCISIAQKVHATFVTKSEAFANGLMSVLNSRNIGNGTHVYTRDNGDKTRPYYRIMMKKKEDIRAIGSFMYEDMSSCPFYLARKREKFVELGAVWG